MRKHSTIPRSSSPSTSGKPAGSATPVHDHLAWGLIGLYRGEQEETVFARRDDDAPVGEREELTLSHQRIVHQGELYPLLPPVEDIHRVRTISAETSVSLHLLTNDTGCIWRHAYDPDTAAVRPIRSRRDFSMNRGRRASPRGQRMARARPQQVECSKAPTFCSLSASSL